MKVRFKNNAAVIKLCGRVFKAGYSDSLGLKFIITVPFHMLIYILQKILVLT